MNNEEKILELLEKLNGRMDQMQESQAQMQTDVNRIDARLDLDIGKRLDALSEGQAIIEKRLDTLDEVRELAEETRDKVDVIHAVVTQHSTSIAELKRVR